MKKFILALSVCLLFTAIISAQPVILDSAFGKNGSVFNKDIGGYNPPNSVIVQEDGKVLVLLFNSMLRYLPNGIPDNQFGTGGMVSLSFQKDGALIYPKSAGLALQSNGKIVVAAYDYQYPSAAVVLERYTQNGNTDLSFGDSGRAYIQTELSFYVSSVAVQDDGKIVIAGGANANGGDILLARYHNNGSIDNSFGINGTVLTDIDGNADGGGSIAITPGNKIILAGASGSNLALLRYKKNGQVDSSFGNNGIALTNIQGLSWNAAIVKINDSHKIFYHYQIEGYNYGIIKCSEDGVIDSSFGKNGIIKDSCTGFAFTDDGKIITSAGIDSNIILKRYRQNGKPDKSFGVSGRVSIYMGRIQAVPAMALQEDGKIITAAQSQFARIAALSLIRFKYQDNAFSNYSNTELQKTNSDVTKISGIYVSPNPVKDRIQLNGLKNINSAKISIYDANGKMLFQKTVLSNANTINVARLSSGAYFLKIDDGKKINDLKFIKQ